MPGNVIHKSIKTMLANYFVFNENVFATFDFIAYPSPTRDGDVGQLSKLMRNNKTLQQ